MKIALMTIATGKVYQQYARNMFESARKYFPEHDQVVFTDDPIVMSSRHKRFTVSIHPFGYPEASLFRYKLFMSQKYWLRMHYDQVFFCDADMEFVAPVGNIFSPALTATLHPGYYGKKGTPETRIESKAFCDFNDAYYCGGFQGGSSSVYLEASRVIDERIDQDRQNGIVAVWHDESHWNRYLADHKLAKDIKYLPPSYCYPEDYDGGYGWTKEQFPPILVALDKHKRGNHPRLK